MPDRPGRGDLPVRYLGIRRPSGREWRRAVIIFAGGFVVLTLMFIFIRPQPSLLAVGSTAPLIKLDSAAGGVVSLPAAAGVVPTVYLVKLGRIAFAGAGPDGVSALPAAVQKAIGG